MASVLVMERCDLECETNNKRHRTSDFGIHCLVVRRGQAFRITVYYKGRGFQQHTDTLTFTAQTGPCPNEVSGTKSQFPLTNSLNEEAWSAAVEQNDNSALTLKICSPPDARIGRYTLNMEATTAGKGVSIPLGQFILLFNPWCSGDSVFMDDEAKLREYVLTQDGLIYTGTDKRINSMPWNFGQFESGILDICLDLLDKSKTFQNDKDKDCSRRNNPVYISRIVSAMVNCNDDDGILMGRWDNNYGDGISPLQWMGSVKILRNWQNQSCQPVRYGQCWVFGAVACTVLRCLGIPTRVVTNFSSAHDTNGNLIIERYLDETGKEIKKSKDSIWNFHVWDECWMARPDLGKGYDGWQAVDPTPQERSEGVYCCGPAPVQAIREGDIKVKYDLPFVFAEVNADVIYWMQRRDGKDEKVVHSSVIGKSISTKSVGSDAREDITYHYKYPEGSEEERRVFEKADLQNKLAQKPVTDLEVKIKVVEAMKYGCDFNVSAVIVNKTSSDRVCRLMFCARTISYNGEIGNECGMKDLLNLEIPANQEKSVPLRVLYNKYCTTMTEDNLIKLMAILFEYKSKDIMLATRSIVIDNPDIKIKILGEPGQFKKVGAEVTLKNPLPVPLTNCSFTIEGAGLTEGQVCENIRDVDKNQEAKAKLYFTPKQSGMRKLVVEFNSNKLQNVKGYRNVIIAPVRR
ncbi:protein-glutamine gamma-glutamyltransferase 2 [Protopterus annectens]|uniref:protein-glutamine gamma-glutamyltransferase 2 n=1 Tax=Protopterus annectens TaxID=7888 RepID=UPI001CFA05DD|nr:protein-glutamine gamma-glutamyltransferase 2 [Protopterus annectens]